MFISNITPADARKAAARAQREGRRVPALYAAVIAAEEERQTRVARLRARHQPNRHYAR